MKRPQSAGILMRHPRNQSPSLGKEKTRRPQSARIGARPGARRAMQKFSPTNGLSHSISHSSFRKLGRSRDPKSSSVVVHHHNNNNHHRSSYFDAETLADRLEEFKKRWHEERQLRLKATTRVRQLEASLTLQEKRMNIIRASGPEAMRQSLSREQQHQTLVRKLHVQLSQQQHQLAEYEAQFDTLKRSMKSTHIMELEIERDDAVEELELVRRSFEHKERRMQRQWDDLEGMLRKAVGGSSFTDDHALRAQVEKLQSLVCHARQFDLSGFECESESESRHEQLCEPEIKSERKHEQPQPQQIERPSRRTMVKTKKASHPIQRPAARRNVAPSPQGLRRIGNSSSMRTGSKIRGGGVVQHRKPVRSTTSNNRNAVKIKPKPTAKSAEFEQLKEKMLTTDRRIQQVLVTRQQRSRSPAKRTSNSGSPAVVCPDVSRPLLSQVKTLARDVASEEVAKTLGQIEQLVLLLDMNRRISTYSSMSIRRESIRRLQKEIRVPDPSPPSISDQKRRPSPQNRALSIKSIKE